ncbi:hypothetical protein N7468_003176 [Penicillium chermesinum]|uniref:Uncharacterized protein n=1 Tax=Penicillium chermesinum TaxID=63820 RepID=A0A9W9P8T5_9EURO|nr:uncharacterized protein N7468_003176 [Penicillium chermesinum]KAJ5238557.1 hypothetical protein N7468_003176 [Penicillium chermesinum]
MAVFHSVVTDQGYRRRQPVWFASPEKQVHQANLGPRLRNATMDTARPGSSSLACDTVLLEPSANMEYMEF